MLKAFSLYPSHKVLKYQLLCRNTILKSWLTLLVTPIIAVIPDNLLLLYFHARSQEEHQALKPAGLVAKPCITLSLDALGPQKDLFPLAYILTKSISKTVDTSF